MSHATVTGSLVKFINTRRSSMAVSGTVGLVDRHAAGQWMLPVAGLVGTGDVPQSDRDVATASLRPVRNGTGQNESLAESGVTESLSSGDRD